MMPEETRAIYLTYLSAYLYHITDIVNQS